MTVLILINQVYEIVSLHAACFQKQRHVLFFGDMTGAVLTVHCPTGLAICRRDANSTETISIFHPAPARRGGHRLGLFGLCRRHSHLGTYRSDRATISAISRSLLLPDTNCFLSSFLSNVAYWIGSDVLKLPSTVCLLYTSDAADE